MTVKELINILYMDKNIRMNSTIVMSDADNKGVYDIRNIHVEELETGEKVIVIEAK